MSPPELTLFLESEGLQIERGRISDPGLFIRGSTEVIDDFVAGLDTRDLALGILGNPLSDFAGLPVLLRALETRRISCALVPGMPRATLQAAISMPLVPLPPGSAHHTWDDMVEVMARLRRSCPWDREQTHRSLVPFLIEETYELAEAIELDKDAGLCEELGDLLLQVLFHAQLATEVGRFSIADVVDGLANKMIRRHPHVFGDQAVAGVADVWQNWEQIKSKEASGQARESRLDGIPKDLGALQRGQRMQDKASRVGFDWPDARAVTEKVAEELAELTEARAHTTGKPSEDPHLREELGDVLFSVVNFARALGIDAEAALREANDKFYRRFTYMERRAVASGRALNDLSMDELEELWQLAKLEAA
jgi:tetrapyrrole methylase family protein/MazG family protein